jgi:hypothetical protein
MKKWTRKDSTKLGDFTDLKVETAIKRNSGQN